MKGMILMFSSQPNLSLYRNSMPIERLSARRTMDPSSFNSPRGASRQRLVYFHSVFPPDILLSVIPLAYLSFKDFFCFRFASWNRLVPPS